MTTLFKCITNPFSCSKDDVQAIFVRKCKYVKGCYFDDDGFVQDDA